LTLLRGKKWSFGLVLLFWIDSGPPLFLPWGEERRPLFASPQLDLAGYLLFRSVFLLHFSGVGDYRTLSIGVQAWGPASLARALPEVVLAVVDNRFPLPAELRCFFSSGTFMLPALFSGRIFSPFPEGSERFLVDRKATAPFQFVFFRSSFFGQ